MSVHRSAGCPPNPPRVVSMKSREPKNDAPSLDSPSGSLSTSILFANSRPLSRNLKPCELASKVGVLSTDIPLLRGVCKWEGGLPPLFIRRANLPQRIRAFSLQMGCAHPQPPFFFSNFKLLREPSIVQRTWMNMVYTYKSSRAC